MILDTGCWKEDRYLKGWVLLLVNEWSLNEKGGVLSTVANCFHFITIATCFLTHALLQRRKLL
jgi:hypothetical protein